MPKSLPLLLLFAPTLLGSGCVDNTLVARPFDDVAVVSGDFDRMELTLDRLETPYQVYEGYICCASYDPDIDPSTIALHMESLFANDENNKPELFRYDALLLNSGVRGFGAYQYNGVEADDSVVGDPERLEILRTYVEDNGRVLVVSDWSYDIVEALWPDAVTFYGDETALDAAQLGSPGQVDAAVRDESLSAALGQDTLSIELNYSYWAVMTAVGPDTDVYLTGSVEYRISESEGYDVLDGAPLLISFKAGQGTVVYSSFHWNTQTPAMAEITLGNIVDGFSGSRSGGASTEDSNAQ